ncbi:MAG: hypothetical protein Q9M31_06330 [Mariprofundus sp.]|nr:hypothetical protein [Mariprofundus sp.]
MEKIKENILSASLQALKLLIIRFFTIPFTIWTGSLVRLAEQWKETPSTDEVATEFPIFDWFKSAWDAVILLLWPIGVIAFVFSFLSGIFSSYIPFGAGLATAFGCLIGFYFAPISASLMKEMLVLFLSMAQSLEKIAAHQGLDQKGLDHKETEIDQK